MKNENLKMKNEHRTAFKEEFKRRMYTWVLRLIRFIDSLPKTMSRDILGRQLLRSGTSILANYVEANSASSRNDFINYFTHSLKSANETKVWLAILRDTGSKTKEAAWLLGECQEIAGVIAASILTLKGKR